MTFYCFGCNLVRSLSFVRFAPINVRVRPIPLYPQSLRLVSERDQVVSDSALNQINVFFEQTIESFIRERNPSRLLFVLINRRKLFIILAILHNVVDVYHDMM